MRTPFPSLTETWHSSSYPAISPSRPELFVKGRTVLVTGGGVGIGAGITRAFAEAGAACVALMSRSEKNLLATKASIEDAFPAAKVLTVVADVTDRQSVQTAFDYILDHMGKIDICVCNAGVLGTAGPAATVDPETWFEPYEVNVKGSLLVAQAFLRQATSGSFLLHIASGMSHMPAVETQLSAYVSSKAASTKLFDYIAFENPSIHVVNIQPGIVASEGNRQSGAPVLDDPELPGHFCVWLVSPEAQFLKSKYVWVNWDVDELKVRKKEILETELLDIKLDALSFKDWKLANLFEFTR
ncbi:NAD(P)-binding protein [Rhizodiscina lignyota]|uniref:NAD(P)-binding protein n=1 Tax=Rhizodiscina lignyota TaxID=1504668 RepID=A0A9P4M6B3_9PEZI|nr:NAD(P)-binding protein [Rhizodiscina lignyota]